MQKVNFEKINYAFGQLILRYFHFSLSGLTPLNIRRYKIRNSIPIEVNTTIESFAVKLTNAKHLF